MVERIRASAAADHRIGTRHASDGNVAVEPSPLRSPTIRSSPKPNRPHNANTSNPARAPPLAHARRTHGRNPGAAQPGATPARLAAARLSPRLLDPRGATRPTAILESERKYLPACPVPRTERSSCRWDGPGLRYRHPCLATGSVISLGRFEGRPACDVEHAPGGRCRERSPRAEGARALRRRRTRAPSARPAIAELASST